MTAPISVPVTDLDQQLDERADEACEVIRAVTGAACGDPAGWLVQLACVHRIHGLRLMCEGHKVTAERAVARRPAVLCAGASLSVVRL